jgi:D-sedoheptulose 7-phosphate isomerase
MVNKFYLKRKGLPAIDLTTNSANITSIANDFDFKYIFSRQIDALGSPGDVALGLTTSGQSPNVIEALKTARKKQLKTLCLCGEKIGSLEKVDPDCIIPVPSGDTPAVQEMHLFILHFMAESIENSFFGEKSS